MNKFVKRFLTADEAKNDTITAEMAREYAAYGPQDNKSKRDRFISLIQYTNGFIRHKASASVNNGKGGKSCTIDFANGYETLMNDYYYRAFTLFYVRKGFTVLDLSEMDKRLKGSFCIHWA